MVQIFYDDRTSPLGKLLFMLLPARTQVSCPFPLNSRGLVIGKSKVP